MAGPQRGRSRTHNDPCEYESTHPWISFNLDHRSLSHKVWLALGEACSKIEHIAGVPLLPGTADRLYRVYLARGIHGTTSIEGNTLTTSQVMDRIDNRLELPPSRDYLGVEIDNILEACNEILADVAIGNSLNLDIERIKYFNGLILDGLPVSPEVRPGVIREHSVAVANYKAVPAEDCEYLLDKLCQWLNSAFENLPRELVTPCAILRAIIAHLYLAWIHPFGDGNGRTARLVEVQLLLAANVPSPAAHLLSDHYNRTRDRYYLALDETSRPPYRVEGFIEYALEGLVDELREQISVVRTQQLQVTWENFVHTRFHDRDDTQACARQRRLALDLSSDEWITPKQVLELTPRLARMYADKTPKTVSRDLNQLEKLQLIQRKDQRVRANKSIVLAFLPLRAQADEDPILQNDPDDLQGRLF